MSKDKKLIPELRFPEFDKDGKWDIKTFKELMAEITSIWTKEIYLFMVQGGICFQ